MLELPGYKVEKQIGKGGMARVYLALHEGLDRHVAIKVMSKNLDDDDSSFSDRFIREARIVAKLSHTNIITVFDVGAHDGHNYIAMELVPGITLDDKIKEGISTQQALITMKEMASALDYAHTRDIVHRDVKPENIMFREDGSSVLTDFGIAKSTTSETKMTAAGSVIGTPHYMSPEQAQGLEVGSFSDIYSLGVVFYEMLTGNIPYDADSTIAIVFKHISDPIPSLGDDLVQFQPLIDGLLAKDPKQRYQTGKDVVADIEQLERGETPDNATQIYSKTTIDQAVKSSGLQPQAGGKKSKWPAFAGITVVIAALGVGGFLYVDMQEAEKQEQALAEKTRLEKENQLARKKMLAEKKERMGFKQRAEEEELSAENEKLDQERLTKQREANLKEQERKAAAKNKRDQKRLAKQKKIDDLLRKAETELLNSKLSEAHKTFSRVLRIDSKNRTAKSGITRIASRYLSLATNEAIKGNFDKADSYIGSVIQISPTHNQLASTQKNIFDLKNKRYAEEAKKTRQAQVAPKKEEKKRRSFGGF
jgi:tRNA A-37 threonylcarbamoyl transferase component Bud32